MRFSTILTATACVTGLALAVSANAGNIKPIEDNAEVVMKPTGKGFGAPELIDERTEKSNGVANGHDDGPIDTAKPGGGGGGSNGISYHGGPVMTGQKHIYFIWYGNWSGNTATTILTDWARAIGGSPYFNINTTYTNGSGGKVDNSASYVSSRNDNYSKGTSLSDAAIQQIVAAGNPTDTNGVYFVLTSADVNASSGFCTQYCGWHTHGTINGLDIKYSFVGNPDRCPTSCADQTTSPNGNAGADGMASIVSHEFEEAASDPDLNAWYDRRGQENADKCAWTFGTTHTVANGSKANVHLGSRDYLIQQNWVNAAGGYCAMSY